MECLFKCARDKDDAVVADVQEVLEVEGKCRIITIEGKQSIT